MWGQVPSAPHCLLPARLDPRPVLLLLRTPRTWPGDQGRQQPWMWAGEARSWASSPLALSGQEGLRGQDWGEPPPASWLCDLRQVAQPPWASLSLCELCVCVGVCERDTHNGCSPSAPAARTPPPWGLQEEARPTGPPGAQLWATHAAWRSLWTRASGPPRPLAHHRAWVAGPCPTASRKPPSWACGSLGSPVAAPTPADRRGASPSWV